MEALLDQVESHFRYDADHPPAGDQFIGVFSIAMPKVLADASLRTFVDRTFAERTQYERNVNPRYLANLLLRVFQKQFYIDQGDEDYPYSDPEQWFENIHRSLTDKLLRADFAMIVKGREVQSNIAERYKSVKLIGMLYEDRFGPEPAILDIGASQNQGLKKLALQLPFDPVAADPANEHLHAVNELLDRDWRPGDSMGVDLWAQDQEISRWAKSCSFRPAELFDTEKIRLYDVIDEAPNVPPASFSGGVDFAVTPPTYAYPHRYRSARDDFDIACLSSSLYVMSSSQQRCIMLRNAYQHTQAEGLIVVTDFAVPDSRQPEGLALEDEAMYKGEYRYRTLVFDKLQPQKGFQEFFAWRTGRCDAVRLGRAGIEALERVA